MSKKVARYYQQEAIGAILRDWAYGIDRCLIGMCTGSGKTFSFCKLLEEIWQPGKRANRDYSIRPAAGFSQALPLQR